MNGVLAELASQYQQLYLTPGDEAQYRKIVLKGKKPEKKDLSHFKTHPFDAVTWEDMPAGGVRVVYLYEREDFELFLQIMAKKCQSVEIPSTQGAAIIDGKEEFRRFTMNESNYTDALIVLSGGPYSGVSAEEAGMREREWIDNSIVIRKYHECTHFICRRLYPQKIDAVWDEIVADAVGIRAAFGAYFPDLAERFLGIQNGAYIGGRLENYVAADEDIHDRTIYCHEVIQRIQKLSEANASLPPYQFALILEERKDSL